MILRARLGEDGVACRVEVERPDVPMHVDLAGAWLPCFGCDGYFQRDELRAVDVHEEAVGVEEMLEAKARGEPIGVLVLVCGECGARGRRNYVG